MSITAARPVSHALAERAYALLSRLLAVKGAQGRLYRNLKDLPDHLLLDIGVDPRDVPTRAGEADTRPDVLWQDAAAVTFRTAAYFGDSALNCPAADACGSTRGGKGN